MGLIDFILNLAGLLFWLNWRAARVNPLNRSSPATLMGTLRPTVKKTASRWPLLLVTVGLLVLRGVGYRLISYYTSVWNGTVNLQVIVLSFRSDSFPRMLEFSALSFGLMLGVFYSWLLFFSLLAGPEPLHKVVKVQIGRVDDWPRWVKVILPLVIGAVLWWPINWLLAESKVIPLPVSISDRLEKSVVIGLGPYLTWQYPICVVLILHLMNTYIYFGKHPFWIYVGAVAEKLLRPLRGLWSSSRSSAYSPAVRAATKGLLTLIAIMLTFLAAQLASRGLNWLYIRLPF